MWQVHSRQVKTGIRRLIVSVFCGYPGRKGSGNDSIAKSNIRADLGKWFQELIAFPFALKLVQD